MSSQASAPASTDSHDATSAAGEPIVKDRCHLRLTKDDLTLSWYTPKQADGRFNIMADDVQGLRSATTNAYHLTNVAKPSLPVPLAILVATGSDAAHTHRSGVELSSKDFGVLQKLACSSILADVGAKQGLFADVYDPSVGTDSMENHRLALQIIVERDAKHDVRVRTRIMPIDSTLDPSVKVDTRVETIKAHEAEHNAALMRGRYIQRVDSETNIDFFVQQDRMDPGWRVWDASISPWRPDDELLQGELDRQKQQARGLREARDAPVPSDMHTFFPAARTE